MTTQRKIEILGVLVLALVAAAFLASWIQEREARIKAEATQAADEKVISVTADAIKSRDALAAQYTAALAKQAAAVQTPQQAAQVIERYLPAPAGAPAAPIVTVDRAQLTPSQQQALPNAPSYGVLTNTQLEDVAKEELACDAAKTNLTACQADEADLHTEIAAKTNEASSWEAAAKGGTKWQRFGRALKCAGFSGAGAGVGAVADKSHPAEGSVIGAAAGVIGCLLF
jgi:hypothetical protein